MPYIMFFFSLYEREREREREVGSKENEKEQEIVPLRLFLSNLVSDEDFLRTCYMISF